MDVTLLRSTVNHMRTKPLWPGFESHTIAVALYDGHQTWLWDHPAPPKPFAAVSEGLFRMAGQHPDLVANSLISLGEVPTATVILPHGRPQEEVAALIVHEQFHVFQRAAFPDWSPNEMELLTYPVLDEELFALRLMETNALSRALQADDKAGLIRWAGVAVRSRMERVELLPSGASRYEAELELLEGLATYVDHKSLEDHQDHLPLEDWAPELIRQRSYIVGRAWALLLDLLSAQWQQALAAEPSRPLYSLVADLLEGTGAAQWFTAEESERFYHVASQAMERVARGRHEARADFLAEPGARLMLDVQEGPLQLAGFDPINIRLVGDSEVLHSRYLKLRGSAGELELLERASLTVAAGVHPLFSGIRQVLLTGLQEPPAWLEDGEWTHLVAPGITGRFRSRLLQRQGDRILIGNR